MVVTGCANDGELTAIAPVQKFGYGGKDKFTTNKVFSFSFY
jgi:hypothetical protein